jgi:hypothetical protein
MQKWLFISMCIGCTTIQAVDFTTLENKVLFGYQGWFESLYGVYLI